MYPASVKTIGDQLDAAGKTWKAYQEDIANSATEPKTCRHPPIGAVDPTMLATKTDMYATRHDPWVYFHSIIDSPSCATKVVGLDALDHRHALGGNHAEPLLHHAERVQRRARRPCQDGRPGGLVSADAFFATWVPKILASPAYRADGMLVITFDEAESDGASRRQRRVAIRRLVRTPQSPV